ncbi:MAG: tetratricopeptide repeat protein [Prevotella sp.]|nr:tetratricopeptide repeat protein [Prevotella sp.]
MLLVLLLLSGCSTQKNTSKSRWWHSFNARYNTYFNGQQAFIEGNLAKENGNQDNYTELLPLYPVGNTKSRDLGKAQYDRAIEKAEKAIRRHSIKARPEWKSGKRKTPKDREWLGRKEYNPFLWKAWMLLGKAQFQKGSFDEAAATFSYMARLYQTQPLQNGLARAWLAKCYAELDWLYDAEDVIRNMSRDSMHYRTVKTWDYTYADYYLRNGELEKAVPYLYKVIKHERRNKQRAREWFLMGQIQQRLGNREEAERAFGKVIGCHPPYQLAFNARIAQTEVLANGNPKKMISRLKRMAANDNNKEYLDQVYYAIGNIHLAQHDTLQAIGAYEKGAKEATRSGIEKGVLLLTLGDLYWQRERFADAQRCYGEAIGLLDKERPDYEQLSERSKLLDELVPHTEAIHLQDSLLALAVMPEKERLAAIDRVIEALKQREKEEREAALDAESEQLEQQMGNNNRNQNNLSGTQPRTPAQPTTQGNGQWYFYNPMAVSQGKTLFQRQWGKRENADNWQRANLTVVKMDNPTGETDSEGEETAAETETGNAPQEPATDTPDKAPTDSTATQAAETPADSAALDPHEREYYLAQIPFTDEQKAACHEIIKPALLQSGILFKDKLNNLKLSERQLLRLTNDYPDFPQLDTAWYHLYLLYARQGRDDLARNCLSHLQAEHPASEWTQLLSDPYYAENARFGEHLEDSLYAATYHAFQQDRADEVTTNAQLAASRFPQGEHRPKFIFIEGITLLNQGEADSCIARMKQVVEQYPKSEVSEMAGMIVKGVQEGRRLHGGKFDIGDVWSRRDIALAADSTRSDTLSADPNQNFVFILAFIPDSVSQNQLLYELAKYNFTNFLVRNFDIQTDGDGALQRMVVSGFLNYDEALQYARQLYGDEHMKPWLKSCRSLIVSEQNLALLGTRFSYDDYQQFYEETFVPMKVSDKKLLIEPESIDQIDPEDEGTDEESAEEGEGEEEEEDPLFQQPTRQKQVEDFDFGDDFW